MNKCFVFSGLLLNLIGFFSLYKGMKPYDEGPAIFENCKQEDIMGPTRNKKIKPKAVWVTTEPIFLKAGFWLNIFGFLLQIAGTLMK